MGSTIRGLTSAAVSVAVTFALFYLMHSLISGNDGIDKGNMEQVSIVFGRVKLDDEVRTKDREIPKKPPPPKDPPPPPKMAVQNVQKNVTPMPNMRMPNLNLAVGGSGPYLGGFSQQDMNADGDVIPVVRIPPQYPRRALMAKLEGWVDLEFTITETGTVEDAKVVKAQPPRVFDKSALRAIYKWKFKPKVDDGVAQRRRATQRIDFNLSGGN
ncbi:MAG: energy transducer TonB [bacterium]